MSSSVSSFEVCSFIPTKEGHVAKISACYDSNSQVTGEGVEFEGSNDVKVAKGKVRDSYNFGANLSLLTTDRQSGFDRSLCSVPYKGAVLNLISKFWFEKSSGIVENHVVQVPHPNVTIAKRCDPFPIEMVVRRYMTGSTNTSIWKHYESGVRNYCGHELPDGMVKNQQLSESLFTPTTKGEVDRPISEDDIVKEGIMTREDLEVCKRKSLEVFEMGRKWADGRGLVLVDTKFEMGKDEDGVIRLIDEVLTPDSSRYWIKASYDERMAAGKEPENIDKEFLRLWFRNNCDPYKDEVLPVPPKDLVCELSRRYVGLYEIITGEEFKFEEGEELGKAIERARV